MSLKPQDCHSNAEESLASKGDSEKALKDRDTRSDNTDCVQLTAQAGKDITNVTSKKIPPQVPPRNSSNVKTGAKDTK